MRNRDFALGAIASLGLLAGAEAGIIFDYNGANDYVSANTSLRLADGTPAGPGDDRPFSLKPMQPASGYSGPAFFGGFEVTTSNPTFAQPTAQINASSDGIGFAQATRGLSVDLVVMADVAPSNFDGTSSLILQGAKSGNGSSAFSLLFRSGGDYFITSTSVLSGTGTVNLDAVALGDLVFSTYDTSDLNGVGAASTFDPFVNGFDAVGALVEFDFTPIGSDRALQVDLIRLTVDAVAIPEPSSALAVAGMGLLGLRRRLQR
ncbi:MAG: PEP-CTERM sorting domain-containing protein [Phycisphaerae bacterium]